MCAQTCLEVEELILPEEPILPENPMAHQQKMWDLRATADIKNEETIREYIISLYPVMISLCDSHMEEKVKAQIKHARNTIKSLQVIMQYLYWNGS